MSRARRKLNFSKASYAELFRFLNAPNRHVVIDEDLVEIQNRIIRLEGEASSSDSDDGFGFEEEANDADHESSEEEASDADRESSEEEVNYAERLDVAIDAILKEKNEVASWLIDRKRRHSNAATKGFSVFDLLTPELRITILEYLTMYERFDLCTVSHSFSTDINNSKIKHPYLYHPILKLTFTIPNNMSVRAFILKLNALSIEESAGVRREIKTLVHLNMTFWDLVFSTKRICGINDVPLIMLLVGMSSMLGLVGLVMPIASYLLPSSYKGEPVGLVVASVLGISLVTGAMAVKATLAAMEENNRSLSNASNWTARLFPPKQHTEVESELEPQLRRRKLASQ